jgi:uncharacterized protein (DUF488 family)
MPLDLLTVGHSNLATEQFMGLLRGAGVNAIADVRSVPYSRRFPWFSQRPLAERLKGSGIAYLPMGEALGGRPADPALYRDGVADYAAIAASDTFRAGLDAAVAQARGRRLCLMCAEREPLDCHRCLLIARALAERGVSVGHILADGSIEPQSATEDRLLGLSKDAPDLFGDRQARLAEAYRRRNRAIAARRSG